MKSPSRKNRAPKGNRLRRNNEDKRALESTYANVCGEALHVSGRYSPTAPPLSEFCSHQNE